MPLTDGTIALVTPEKHATLAHNVTIPTSVFLF